jgi:predicted DsbA family dithiol-disulfide isomerase
LLIDLAESIGLNKNEIINYIKSDEPYNKLKEINLRLRKYGINGVPTFIIGDIIVVGAQPYEVFEKIIKNVLGKDVIKEEIRA